MSYGTGGGASHIATKTGKLEDLSEDLSDILIVAGGGGGGGLSDTTPGNAGGYIGGNPTYNGSAVADRSGTQSTGYMFGKGESGHGVAPGAGGGFYGGLAGKSTVAGGGSGSGYIGNSLLTGDKKMIGYGVSESNASSTKTYSRETKSSTAISNKTKMGNGFVRITYLHATT